MSLPNKLLFYSSILILNEYEYGNAVENVLNIKIIIIKVNKELLRK